MAVIHLDGETYEVSGADNLLHACLSLGLDIPYFCWHPSLGSVGSCRQCAVKQYQSKEDMEAGKGRIVMSCMVETSSDLYISIEDDEAEKFRESITEFLMTNHPHDCPTCEEGGHCHLQDMTYMTHHDRREYRFTKRTHNNQELGPFINHEMNRCIACYRCVRYYGDYAGGTDLGVYASASRVYFGRAEDGVLESEFAGNLTEICPTGVFTDKTHSDHYTRKWDMQYAPSVCQGCSLGCNISVGERYGEVRRVENRYNDAVNGYFLCDKGRFGYDVVNAEDRPSKTLIDGAVSDIDTAIDTVAKLVSDTKTAGGTVVGISSNRASLETSHALKTLVGNENFSTGVRSAEQALVAQCVRALQDGSINTPTLKQVEDADCVLILGEDITNTAARLALSVRQAAKNKAEEMTARCKTATWLAEPRARIGQHEKSPIFILGTHVTRLDDVAAVSTVATPEKMVEFASEVVDLIESAEFNKSAEDASLVLQVANALVAAKNPLIISGTSLGSSELLTAAQKLTKTLASHFADKAQAAQDIQAGEDAQEVEVTESSPSLYLVTPAVNSVGVQQLGGKSLDDVLGLPSIDVLVVAENDLSYQLSDKELGALLKQTKKLVVLDSVNLPWHTKADVLLPAASFAETDGTCISAEGRAQRYFQVYEPSYYKPDTQVVASWRWLHAIDCQAGAVADTNSPAKPVAWAVLDDVVSDIAQTYPVLAGIKDAAPTDDYRISGLKVAREPRRYSGRTAMRAPVSVHEPKQPVDADTALTYSMEGYVGDQTQSAIIPFAWAPGWNSPQSWNKFQKEVGGPLKQGDAGVRLFGNRAEEGAEASESAEQAVQHEKTNTQSQGEDATVFSSEGMRLMPMYDLFSSGELARASAVLSERSAAKMQASEVTTYGKAFTVSAETAAKIGVGMDESLSLIIGDEATALPVRIVEYMPADVVGYPKAVFPALLDAVQANDGNIQLKPSLASVANG